MERILDTPENLKDWLEEDLKYLMQSYQDWYDQTDWSLQSEAGYLSKLKFQTRLLPDLIYSLDLGSQRFSHRPGAVFIETRSDEVAIGYVTESLNLKDAEGVESFTANCRFNWIWLNNTLSISRFQIGKRPSNDLGYIVKPLSASEIDSHRAHNKASYQYLLNRLYDLKEDSPLRNYWPQFFQLLPQILESFQILDTSNPEYLVYPAIHLSRLTRDWLLLRWTVVLPKRRLYSVYYSKFDRTWHVYNDTDDILPSWSIEFILDETPA